MTYLETIHSLLKPVSQGSPLVLDLFAGCGGLALGFETQGFETLGFEMDADCVATYKRNLSGDCLHAKLTPDFPFPRVIGVRFQLNSTFIKKSQQTPDSELKLARKRLKEMKNG